MFVFFCVLCCIWLVLSLLGHIAVYKTKQNKLYMLKLAAEGRRLEVRYWTYLVDLFAIAYVACFFCGVFK